MSWSDKYKKSIDCNNPKGFSQKAHCAGKKKSMNEMSNPRIPKKSGQPDKSDKHSDLYTDEDPNGTIHGLGFKDVATAKESVSKIKNSGRSHAHKIQAAIAMEQRAKVMGKNSEAAVYRKFINSMKEKTKEMSEESKKCKSGYYYCYTNKKCKPIPPGFMIDPAGMLAKENGATIDEEGLRDWFGKSKSKDGKPGWVQSDGSPCANEPGETKTPKCFSRSKLASMSKGEIASAVRRKRQQDPGQQSKSGAASPTYVSTDSPTKKMKKESFNENHKAIAAGREKDEEGYMASTEMDTIDSAVKKLRKIIKKGDSQLPAWVQSKITKAADYIDTAADYLDSNEMSEESDAKGKGSGTKDACYHKVKSRYSVWPSAYASGALVKCRKVGAANWGNKSEEVEISLVEKILGEEMMSFKINKTPHNDMKKQEKIRSKTFSNDNEAEVAKSKLRPSAAVSLPLNNEYQPKLTELVLGEEKCGKGMYWCNTNKECKPLPKGFDVPGQKMKPTEVGIGKPVEGSCSKTKKGKDCPVHGMDECPMSVDEACWKGYKKKGMETMFGKKYPNCVKVENVEIEESVRIPARTGNIISVMFNWRGKTYGTKIFFPQIGIPTRKDVEYEIQKIYPDCRILTFKVSEFVPGQPLIYVNKSMNEEIEIQEVAAWQKKEGKNPEGGLNAKGVASYRKENPGSKLQTAVTTEPSKLKPGSKDAKRRKSFCARMSGVDGPMKDEKGRPTRKALALGKWNCN